MTVKNNLDPLASKNYENIPISEEVKNGLSWNNNDIHLLKRHFDRQDEVISQIYDEHAIIITDEVRKMLDERDKKIFETLLTQEEKIFTALKHQEEKIFTALKLQEEKVSGALNIQNSKIDIILEKQLLNEKNILSILNDINDKFGFVKIEVEGIHKELNELKKRTKVNEDNIKEIKKFLKMNGNDEHPYA
jgi:archaellum component FlaC